MSWMSKEIGDRGGAVPFDEFMELALYHPVFGYYSGEEPRYGRGGDYLTAPTASEWYPRVVARLLAGLAGHQGGLNLVDVASGDGAFVAGVLGALGAGSSQVLRGVVSVERSEAMRSRQIELLAQTPAPVRRVATVLELEPESGPTVVHASELYDAQPVARVVGRRGGLQEHWVVADGGGGARTSHQVSSRGRRGAVPSGVCDPRGAEAHLTVRRAPRGEKTPPGAMHRRPQQEAGEICGLRWQERPARREVAAYFARHRVAIEENQVAEANLTAEAMHRRLLTAAVDSGLCLVLDYGYEARRLYDPRGRAGGSLATFRRHRAGRDPLESPGEVDLTAHVNWDDLRAAAAAEGWAEVGLWPLAEFLVRAGIEAELDACGLGIEAELNAATVTARQEVKRLLDPEGMGSDLKVLVQARGEMVEAARAVLNSEFGIRNSE